ncbi:MAG: hypothetical protein AB1656_07930 [Candidatus Omnitrophota bacterium]
MLTVEEIKTAIESLPDDDIAQLRKWFSEKDWENWDKEILADSQAGRLDFLANEALTEKSKGSLKNL